MRFGGVPHPATQEPRSRSKTLDPLIEPAPVPCQVLDDAQHAGRQGIGGRGENAWQLSAQEAQALPHGNATLQQEGADLIDNAGALTDQPLTHAVDRTAVAMSSFVPGR